MGGMRRLWETRSGREPEPVHAGRPPENRQSRLAVRVPAVGQRRAPDAHAPATPLGYPECMPLYEYECQDCHQRFELLVRASTTLECPTCHSTTLEKQLSVFAVSAPAGPRGAANLPVAPCGSCGHPAGPGSCSLD